MGNKTILILTQYFAPEMGAPQSRLLEMATGLKSYGWDVKVITSLPNYPTGKIFPDYKGKFRQVEKIKDIEVYRYWIYASNSKKPFPRVINMLSFSMLSFLSVFRIRKMRPAFIITESPPLTLGLTGLTLAKFSGARHLLNVSDIWPLSAFELGAISKGKMYHSLEALEKYLYRRSYGCLGQSQQIIDHIKAQGISRVCLFRNGVDTKRFDISHAQRTCTGGKISIVYAGLLGIAQGILGLCQHLNFSELNSEFHIYGSGNEEEALKSFIQENPGRGIFFRGKLNRDEVPKALVQHDITIIPLHKAIYGAVPSKIYEAMAAGLPILFSGGGEGAEIVDKYQTGWVCPPSDFEEMKRIIQRVAQLPSQQIIDMGKRSKGIAASIFDRSIQINNLHQFLLQNADDRNN